MKEQLKGIAAILFGILLCSAEEGLNSIVLHNFSDFPFSLLGLLFGGIGLFLVFRCCVFRGFLFFVLRIIVCVVFFKG